MGRGEVRRLPGWAGAPGHWPSGLGQTADLPGTQSVDTGHSAQQERHPAHPCWGEATDTRGGLYPRSAPQSAQMFGQTVF